MFADPSGIKIFVMANEKKTPEAFIKIISSTTKMFIVCTEMFLKIEVEIKF